MARMDCVQVADTPRIDTLLLDALAPRTKDGLVQVIGKKVAAPAPVQVRVCRQLGLRAHGGVKMQGATPAGPRPNGRAGRKITSHIPMGNKGPVQRRGRRRVAQAWADTPMQVAIGVSLQSSSMQ